MEVNITDERPELDLIITEDNQEFDLQVSDDGHDVTVNIDDESDEVLIEISDEEPPTKITIEESHGLSAYQLYLATTTANPPLSLKDWLDSFGGGSATQYIDAQISDVKSQITSLDAYLEGAFSDGIISAAEAVAIEKYLNQINTEKADVQATYSNLYNNATLTGTPKTNLGAAWVNYDSAHQNLVNSINAAITDGKTTVAEKADVDAKFVLYRSTLASLSTRLQEAISAADQPDLSSFEATRDYVDGLLQEELASIQNQLDGVVDDWYLSHSPTLSNAPANEWTTIALKRDHIGDRFTNTEPFIDEATTPDSGKQWRWIETSPNVFAWVLIPNSEATIALNRANDAYDLADGKRRVFTTTPFTPYDIGDMWVQGASGDIMRALVKRQSGAYVSSDWGKASKYTDDSTALAIQQTLNTSISNSLQASKNYADAEIDASEIVVKAYADGKITAAENRSILDATNKSNAAKAYADAQDLLLRTEMTVYADGKVSAEENARILQATNNLTAAKNYAEAQANAAKIASNAYADGQIDIEEARAILDADNKLAQAKQYSDAQRVATEAAMQIYADGKVDELELQMQGTINNSLASAKSYADAQIELSETSTKAYADGIVDAEEARAIADATAKMETAKSYAEAQDLLLRTQMQVYADGIVEAEEQARLDQAAAAVIASQNYSDRQAELSKIAYEAYADGVLDEAEKIAISEAQKARDEAKSEAERLLNSGFIGAKNLLREYDLRFNFKYWGGSGTSEEIDTNAIVVIDGFIMGTSDNRNLITNDNKYLEIWL